MSYRHSSILAFAWLASTIAVTIASTHATNFCRGSVLSFCRALKRNSNFMIYWPSYVSPLVSRLHWCKWNSNKFLLEITRCGQTRVWKIEGPKSTQVSSFETWVCPRVRMFLIANQWRDLWILHDAKRLILPIGRILENRFVSCCDGRWKSASTSLLITAGDRSSWKWSSHFEQSLVTNEHVWNTARVRSTLISNPITRAKYVSEVFGKEGRFCNRR